MDRYVSGYMYAARPSPQKSPTIDSGHFYFECVYAEKAANKLALHTTRTTT
jgi:hypothetical protein